MNSFDRYIIGLVVLVTAIFISRRIAAKGFKMLEADKKAQLLDLFNGDKIWNYLFVVITLLGFYGITRFTEIDPQPAFLVYTLLILG